MNKQYMDFIPYRPRPTTSTVKKSAPAPVSKPVSNTIVKKTELKVEKSESFSIAPKPTPVPPQAHFIKTNVAKRPLSPNVYSKPAPEPSEKTEPTGPVAVISQPKKESRVGLVITIILVILLGAAAGAVAFFLLPR